MDAAVLRMPETSPYTDLDDTQPAWLLRA